MCGIAGMIGLPYNEAVCDDMIQTMKRRGPDDEGRYTHHGCALLHRRLSVRDPVGGRQPMKLSWAGEDYVIVYNGELYNTQELRQELIKLGHSFSNHSDTEIVLHAYCQWSEKAVGKFNGIFAFAIWHEKEKKLFLARDRMGVKPLFYMQHENGLIFASEIKTILCYPTVHPLLDAEGAAQIILLGPGRIPGSGIIKGICELEPGFCGYYQANELLVRQYWKLKDRYHEENFEETADTVRELVLDAIKRQTVSDVQIGAFLSGGLDSSIISAVCADQADGEKIDTFSVDYADNDKYFVPGKFQPESDNSYIEIMRRNIQSNHHWTVLDPTDLVSAMKDSTIARDLPGMADVDFSLLAFCGQINKCVKVALSGECADEIFGGYPWFRDPEIRSAEGFPWAQNTNYRARFMNPDLQQKIDPYSFVMDQYKTSVAQCDILPEQSQEDIQIKQMTYLNQRWFMQTLLDRKDRMSMYNGLEVRVPFCDDRIASYMYAVPWKYKEYLGREKGLLRYAMRGILPEKVLWRKKSPYPKTYDPAYLTLVQNMLRDILAEKDAPIYQIIDRNALLDLLDQEQKWPWYGQLMKGPQTIAYMLQINIWMNEYKIAVE